jgi:hypothetical protein
VFEGQLFTYRPNPDELELAQSQMLASAINRMLDRRRN